MTIRKSLAPLVAGVLLAGVAPQGARAQATLGVDVDINFPSVVILYCFDQITVDFTAGTLLTALGAPSLGQTTALGTGTATGNPLAAGITTLNTTNPATLNNVQLELYGVCAVRAIGSGGTVSADLTLNEPVLQDATNSSTITLSNFVGQDGGDSAGPGGGPGFTTIDSAANTNDFTLDITNFATPRFIDVGFTLDLSATSIAGNHSASADVFTVTVATP